MSTQKFVVVNGHKITKIKDGFFGDDEGYALCGETVDIEIVITSRGAERTFDDPQKVKCVKCLTGCP